MFPSRLHLAALPQAYRGDFEAEVASRCPRRCHTILLEEPVVQKAYEQVLSMHSIWQTAFSLTQDLNPRHAGPEFSGMIVLVIYFYRLLQTVL